MLLAASSPTTDQKPSITKECTNSNNENLFENQNQNESAPVVYKVELLDPSITSIPGDLAFFVSQNHDSSDAGTEYSSSTNQESKTFKKIKKSEFEKLFSDCVVNQEGQIEHQGNLLLCNNMPVTVKSLKKGIVN
ncbi:hypothetical protein BB559_003721 [Furculomyces boomerangus]|uniref:Uncharacterized protein n=1 Tax=Furculomyces boomerangus TaxID=61424 RepID=A0A2T9YJA5_9FUNG|nr:hypothetical protein BB559_003721 [Furculomyces boomerangus]